MAEKPYIEIDPHAASIPLDDDKCKLGVETIQEGFDALCPDNILTHERNPAGTRIAAFEECSGTHIEYGPLVVIDNAGNVVLKG